MSEVRMEGDLDKRSHRFPFVWQHRYFKAVNSTDNRGEEDSPMIDSTFLFVTRAARLLPDTAVSTGNQFDYGTMCAHPWAHESA